MKETPSSSTKPRAISKTKSLHHLVLHGALRGFTIGYSLKTLLSVVRAIVRFVVNRKRRKVSFSNVFLEKDAIALGGSLAMGSVIYRVVYQYCGRNSVMASGCSAISMGLDPNSDRRTQMALYVCMRALECVVRRSLSSEGVLNRIVPESLRERFPLSELIFVTSCTEIMFSWFYHIDRLPPFYSKWITSMSEMHPSLLKLLHGYYHGTLQYGVKSDCLHGYCVAHDIDPVRGNLTTLVSKDIVHPMDPDNCTGNVTRRFTNAFLRSVAIYTPVHLLPTLIFRLHRIASPSTILRISYSVFRSSAFLGSFVGIVHLCICLIRNLRPGDESTGVLLGCAMCGTSVFLEKPKRRLDLALYVAPMALQSMWRRLSAGTKWHIPGFEILIYAISLITVSRTMKDSPEHVRPSLRSLMEWLFMKE